MKFHRTDPAAGRPSIGGYGEDYVLVNGERFRENVIVGPERVTPWTLASFDALAEADFEALAALGPEIVLLGTGARQRFPHPRLSRSLAAARIGLEVMDVGAACRTYNLLLAEERRVAAALILTSR